MTLTGSIRDALGIAHPHESQAEVHRILARQLQELSPRAGINITGYFNHTWAPDMVVSGCNVDDRPVFVRFGVHDATFFDDLEYLGSEQPIFLDLGTRTDDTEPSDELNLSGVLADYEDGPVLVTEVDALGTLDAGVRSDSDLRSATSNVVHGGKGLIDEPGASTIVEGWQKATRAMSEASAEALRSAMDSVELYLSHAAALDVESELRSRWIAAGQSVESFPGRQRWNLEDRAPWEIAQLVASLLSSNAEVSSERWDAIAKAISGSALGHEMYKLGDRFEGGQVNTLLLSGLNQWTARYAYVPPLESDSMERFDWSVGQYSIAINLASRKAYFTDVANKWNRVQRTERLPDVRLRLPMLEDGSVTAVGLVTAEENVSHELRPSASMPIGARLRQFLGEAGDPAWGAARLTSITVNVPETSDATAYVDFRRSVVKASDAVPLRTFVLLCGRYVAGLNASELAELEAVLNTTNDGEMQKSS